MKKLLSYIEYLRLWYMFFAGAMVYLVWGLFETVRTPMPGHAALGWLSAIIALLVAHVWRTLYAYQKKAFWTGLESTLDAMKDQSYDHKGPKC